MKIIIAFFTISAALGAANGFSDIFELVHPMINRFASNPSVFEHSERHKRSTVKLELDDPQGCIGKCARQLNVRIQKFRKTLPPSTTAESTRAAALCEAFRPMTPCIQACPKSQLSTMALHFLPIQTSVCYENVDKPDLMKSFDCINSTKHEISERCKQCASIKRSLPVVIMDTVQEDVAFSSNDSYVYLNLLSSYVSYQDNKTKNTEMFESACKYLACDDDCSAPIIKKACGTDAFQLQLKTDATTLRSIKAMFLDLNALTHDPVECKRYDAVNTDLP